MEQYNPNQPQNQPPQPQYTNPAGQNNYQPCPPQQPYPPQQGKPKKPVYKKWWFWVLIVLAVFIFFSALGSSSGSSDADSGKDTTSVSDTTKGKTTTKAEPTTSKKQFKDSCKTYTYKDVARDPDKYKGKNMKYTGEVLQVIEPTWGDTVEYRIAVTRDDYGYDYDSVIYVTYTRAEGESRILENDIVTFYGTCDGIYSYTSALGGKVTIPKVEAKYLELKK